MPAGEHLQRLEITRAADLRAWLEVNHAQATSIWLVTHKKAQGPVHVPYDAVVEELLAWGWVDSLPRKLDAARSMLLVSPRRPGSAWSAVNKARVAKLEAEGRLAPPGRAAIDAARDDGSWSFLDDVDALEIPPDLADALAGLPPAAAHFAAFPPSTRRGILEWIKQARRAETRSARIAGTARLAKDNQRANQFRPRQG